VADERKEDVSVEQTEEDRDNVMISNKEDDLNNSSSIANIGLDQQEAKIVPESP